MMLYNDDCFIVLEQLISDGVQVDLVLTDPPYSITQCKWDNALETESMWKLIRGLCKPRTPILLFGNEPYSSHLRLSQPRLYKYDIIWDKTVRTGHLNAKRQPMRQYENILVFYDKQPTYNPQMWKGKEPSHTHKTSKHTTNVYGEHHGVPVKETIMKYPSNIVRFNARQGECNNTKRHHPTQKPVMLLEYLIRTYTNEDDTVLDFTMGSGSTGVACKNTDRHFIGIEKDDDYYRVAEERIL